MNDWIRSSVGSLHELDVPGVIYGIGACIVAFAALGAVDVFVTDIYAFDLRGELRGELRYVFNAPTLFSALILLFASLLAARCALAAPRRGDPAWPWAGIGAIFALAAVDDALALHENLEEGTGVEWLVLYLPVFALGAALWVRVLGALTGHPEKVLWVGGATAWVVSLANEAVTYGTRIGGEASSRGVAVSNVGEELLEMAATALFVWAMIVFLAEAGA